MSQPLMRDVDHSGRTRLMRDLHVVSSQPHRLTRRSSMASGSLSAETTLPIQTPGLCPAATLPPSRMESRRPAYIISCSIIVCDAQCSSAVLLPSPAHSSIMILQSGQQSSSCRQLGTVEATISRNSNARACTMIPTATPKTFPPERHLHKTPAA